MCSWEELDSCIMLVLRTRKLYVFLLVLLLVWFIFMICLIIKCVEYTKDIEFLTRHFALILLGIVLGIILFVFGFIMCYILISRIMPDQNRTIPFDPHNVGSSWADDGGVISRMNVHSALTESTRLSESIFQRPENPLPYAAPRLTSYEVFYEIVKKTCATIYPYPEARKHLEDCPRICEAPSSENPSTRRYGTFLGAMGPTDASAEEILKCHRSSFPTIEVPTPYPADACPVTRNPYSEVNYGASTSLSSADEWNRDPLEPRQPTYKKKRSVETDRSDTSSERCDSEREDKTPEKSVGYASDKGSPERSGSDTSMETSSRSSDVSCKSITPGHTDESPTSPSCPDIPQYLVAQKTETYDSPTLRRRTSQAVKALGKSHPSKMEMLGRRLRSHASASSAETSFSQIEVKRKTDISERESSGPGVKKSSRLQKLASSPRYLEVPKLHSRPSIKRKKESSSEDEDKVSAKLRSPTKKPRETIPEISEKEEHDNSEEK